MRGLVPVAALSLLLAACTAEAAPEPPDTPSPFADCAALSAAVAPVGSSAAVAPVGSPAAVAPVGSPAAELPDLELPCFTGGGGVRLADLPRPAVINLWASWCAPCRTELPVLQDLADRAAGRLTVLGVDTGDGRGAAASFAADHAVTMPTLYDPDKKLAGALGLPNLPATIFIDPQGRRHVQRLPLDAAGLAAAVREHTGVTVPR